MRAALFAYLGIVIVLLFFENQLVYRPESAAEHWEDPPDDSIHDFWFDTAGGVAIHGWYCEKPGADEVLLVCHGNGGNLSYRGETLLRFRDFLNCSALIFDYPGYGKSAGAPSERGCYESAAAAMRWLEKARGVAPGNVVIYGESLGGGVAVEIALRQPVGAVVLLKTFTSLPAVAQRQYRWLPVQWLMTNRFDNLAKIPLMRRPVFISSATADTLVPFAMGELLYTAANEPKFFYPLQGENHNDRVSDAFLAELRRFLDLHKPRKGRD